MNIRSTKLILLITLLFSIICVSLFVYYNHQHGMGDEQIGDTTYKLLSQCIEIEEKGNLKEAIKCYEDSLNGIPQSVNTKDVSIMYSRLSSCYVRSGDYHNAIKSFLTMKSRFKIVYRILRYELLLSYCYYKIGNINNAVKSYNEYARIRLLRQVNSAAELIVELIKYEMFTKSSENCYRKLYPSQPNNEVLQDSVKSKKLFDCIADDMKTGNDRNKSK